MRDINWNVYLKIIKKIYIKKRYQLKKTILEKNINSLGILG
jgi:hypothetical protein